MVGTTNYAAWPPFAARIALGGFVLLVIIGLTTPIAMPAKEAKIVHADPNALNDAHLWQNVIDRMRAGQGYYDAMEMALRTVSYDPPKSFYALRPFNNFRLPVLASFLAILRYDIVGQAVLLVLGIAMMKCWLVELRGRLPAALRVFAFLVMTPILNWAIKGGNYVYHDVWIGCLIGLSVALYRWRPVLSIACGLLALSIRELAVPFALVMALCALWEGKRREGTIWLAGIAAFFIYLGIHAYLVSFHVRPDDPAKVWVSCNGWAFILRMAETNLFSILGIPYVSAFLIPLALLGAAGWPNAVGARLTGILVAYIMGYMFIGNLDNWYWGFVCLPLTAVCCAGGLPALMDLGKAAFTAAGHSPQQSA